MKFTSLIIIIVSICFELSAQQFLASSYPSDYHGTLLVSGDRYSKFIETAANNDIPIGSKILITEKNTKRSVLVTINDLIEEPTVDFLLSDAVYKELGLDLDQKILVSVKLISSAIDKDYASLELRNDQLHPKGVSNKSSHLSIANFTEIKHLNPKLFVIQIGAFSNESGVLEFINSNSFLSNNTDEISWFLDLETQLIKISYGSFPSRKKAIIKKETLINSNIIGFIKPVRSY